MARIGFVGLGNMGGPMARNLLRAGHRLKVYDLSAERRNELTDAGATAVNSPAGAATGVDAVITVLPGGKGHLDVFAAPDGLLSAASPSTLFIDCSTCDVEVARAISAAAEKAGHAVLDAPISGGVGGAAEATLTFMVGGAARDVERAQPILAAMGRTIIHTGASGSGAAAKICNNMVVGVTTVALGEAFALAEGIGLSAEKLFEVMSQSSAASWVLSHLCPAPNVVATAPSSRGYVPGGASAMLLKDLTLSQQTALRAHVGTPLGAATTALYALFCAAGGGTLDSSAIIKLIQGETAGEAKR